MIADTQIPRLQTCRLVLIEKRTDLIFVQRSEGMPCLPRISVHRGMRTAPQIQRAIADLWNLKSVVLDFLLLNAISEPAVLVEIRSEIGQGNLTTVGLGELSASELSPAERETIERILFDHSSVDSPFSHVGWIDEAMSWIQASLDGGTVLTGEFEQHNAGGSFALIRFQTERGPAYWLKATGDPNRHELSVTRTLSEICPHYLPPLIATRKDWNAWVTEDAGTPLEQTAPIENLGHAVVSMAELQKVTIPNIQRLLSSGAADQRTHVLIGCIEEVMSFLEEAITEQKSTNAPRLEKARLQELEVALKEACIAMEELGIPSAVIHNDMNYGNILIRNGKCVFTDWCEACIGNPFITLQQTVLLFSSGNARDATANRHLLQAYKACWLDVLDERQIDRAFVLMPLLAAFSFLYGNGKWLKSKRRLDSQFRAYARSLARHMDRAVRDLAAEDAPCR